MANNSPLYQSMLNELIRQIESGEMKENEKLPSEQQLGAIYEVSRITVRRALAELEKKQYIYKKQGQGSFVQQKQDQNLGIQYIDVRQAISNMNLQPKVKLLKFALNIDGSESSIRHLMKLSEDDYFYIIEQLFYGDNVPLLHERIYLNYTRFPEIRMSEIKNNEVIPFLTKKYDLTNAKFSSEKFAYLLTKKERKIFSKSNVGDPMLAIETVGRERDHVFYKSETLVVENLPLYLI